MLPRNALTAAMDKGAETNQIFKAWGIGGAHLDAARAMEPTALQCPAQTIASVLLYNDGR